MVHEHFFHLIDLVIVNSWLLFRKRNEFYMPLIDFILAVSNALIESGKPALSLKRDLSSHLFLEYRIAEKKSRSKSCNATDRC